ncbi:MAG TPA: hypothetical protein VFM54_08575, partial [Micromonosporaceae bacterium]|nr:hypothetical protein [Micromonosporaceae bacterium]
MPEAAAPETFIVRFPGPAGGAVGVGVLVGAREIVTCAHVVNVALGLDARAQPAPTGPVTVELPLLPGGPFRGTAEVVRWLPPAVEGAAGDDIAGLLLAQAPPASARAAQLAVGAPAAGLAVRVFGYPGVPPRPDGAWVATQVRGRVGADRLQLDSVADAAL